jgi:hypothetical protein
MFKPKFLIILLSASLFTFLFSCESNDGSFIHGNPYISTSNKLLVEIFTNTSCIPCVQVNSYFDNINNLTGVTVNDTNVILMRVHTTLFANDPFYNFNPTVNFARQQYYNAGLSNPRAYMMGNSMGSYSSQNYTTLLNQQMQQNNAIGINLTNTFDSTTRAGGLDISLAQVSGSQLSDLVLHCAVVENNLIMNPPAPNGETDFENTLRDWVTNVNGESFTIVPGQALQFHKNYTLRTGIDFHHAYLIVFVQAVASKTVYGVKKINLY